MIVFVEFFFFWVLKDLMTRFLCRSFALERLRDDPDSSRDLIGRAANKTFRRDTH
jgi:hypothetical protein